MLILYRYILFPYLVFDLEKTSKSDKKNVHTHNESATVAMACLSTSCPSVAFKDGILYSLMRSEKKLPATTPCLTLKKKIKSTPIYTW